jgi:hypothetical protein
MRASIFPGTIALAAAISTFSIYSVFAADPAPLTAKPTAGLINDWLRKDSTAFNDWNIGGQFRVRYEAREDAGFVPSRDFLSGLDNSNDYFLFRTKLHVGWTPDPWISIYGEGRDSHDVSDRRSPNETESFDLYQAYVKIGDPKKFPVSLKIGRQEMAYGDERYIGISDWLNTPRSFDAAVLRFDHEYFWLDGFVSRVVIPRDEHFNESNDYDYFSGLYGSTRKLLPFQDTDFYALARNVGAASPAAITPTLGGPGSRDIYTIGTRWKSLPGKFGNWDYVFEFAGQFGGIGRGAARLDHQAFSLDTTGGYTFKEAFGTPRVTLGYDFGTGDSSATDKKNGTFENLFPSNHPFYGTMDLFSQRNMHIPRTSVSMKPIKNLTVTAEWLGFWMAETADFLFPEVGGGRAGNGYGRHPGFNSYVGNELDLNANWKVAPWGSLMAGYGHFFIGDYIRQTAGAGGHGTEDANWFYLQFVLAF